MTIQLDIAPDELQVFLAEAEEQLQLMDESIILLERGGNDPNLLQVVFRAAHTLKGSSSAIGHRRMAELTHTMENLLDLLRTGRLALSTAVVTALLDSLDALRALTEEVSSGEECGMDYSSLTASLRMIAHSACEAPQPDGGAREDEAQARSLTRAEANAYTIEVLIAATSQLPGARAFQVLFELEQLGTITRSQPSRATIEAGHMEGTRLVLSIASEHDAQELQALVESIPEVDRVDVFAPAPSRTASTADNPPLEATDGPGGPSTEVLNERRIIDLGEGARGKGKDELLRLAAQRLGDEGQDDLLRLAAQRLEDETGVDNRLRQTSTRVASTGKTVRVDVERLENLMNLVGELVVDRTRLVGLSKGLAARFPDDSAVSQLQQTTMHLQRISDELQDEVMKSRMLPVASVFNRFPRIVRDLALKAGKQIDFQIEGQDTELDRTVMQEIGDPLIHLLRNAVDHGIEPPEERRERGKDATGMIRLTARQEEHSIIIAVEDDGRGIDVGRVRASAVSKGIVSREAADRMSDAEARELIFAAGLSTAGAVTDVSGRGVGMDIVRTNIERLNGSVTIRSTFGSGSVFSIKLPLTLAIVQALLVRIASQTYAIPLVSVVEGMRVHPGEVSSISGHEVIRSRGKVLPLIRLGHLFNLDDETPGSERRTFIVAIRAGDKQAGMVVDALLGEQEIVIKSLGRLTGEVKGFSGAAILGDGQVAPIIDVPGLINSVLNANRKGVNQE